MCKRNWTPLIAGIVIAMGVVIGLMVGHAFPQEVCSTTTLAKAQEQVATANGTSMVLASPADVATVNDAIRLYTRGTVALEPGTNAVLLATAPAIPTPVIAEFKDNCMVSAGVIPQELVEVIAKAVTMGKRNGS